jgi:hypothetical protein
VLVAQAAAAANGERASRATKASAAKKGAHTPLLDARLTLKLKAANKHRSTIRFFKTHRQLFRSGEHHALAVRVLRRATRSLARVNSEISYYRWQIRIRDGKQEARRLAKAPPREAICGVFGRYCRQALAVAWCESGLSPYAQNGQYLGLFQMGSSERRLFGHGLTAHEQALAAHRYFVRSGSDWSPWSCSWAAV